MPGEGGTERAVYYLSRELALKGQQVSVVTSNSNNSLTDHITADYNLVQSKTADYGSIEKLDGFTVYRYPYLIFRNKPTPLVSLPMLSFNLSNYDVIHLQGLNMTSSFTLLSSLIRLKGKKFIATTHGVAEFSGRPKHEIFYTINLYLKRAERIIAVCNYESKMLNRLGIPEEKIIVIPNGVDLKRFNHILDEEQAEVLRKEFFLSKNVVLTVGRVVRNKGFENLVKAAAFFKDKDITFMIVGPTPDEQYLQALRSLMIDFGVTKKFVLTGWLPDKIVADLYLLSDIFVFPSTLDTFGLVNLDAMAAGKPIVATSTGGVPEIVRTGENGIIVKPGDYMELAKAIDKLVNDSSLCESMGQAGKKLAYANYSWEKISSMTLKLYRSLC